MILRVVALLVVAVAGFLAGYGFGTLDVEVKIEIDETDEAVA